MAQNLYDMAGGDPAKQQQQPMNAILEMAPKHDRGELMKAQYVASALMPDLMQQVRIFTDIGIILLGWISVSLEVFIRFNFGERYLSNVRLALSFVFMGIVAFSSLLIGWFNTGGMIDRIPSSVLFLLFFLAFCAVSVFQRGYIWFRNNVLEQPWHSMSTGVSWLELFGVTQITIGKFKLDDWFLYSLIEPFACFFVSLIILLVFDMTTGIWLLTASLALLIRNQMLYNEARGRILDMVDARIEAQYLQESLKGTRKSKTAGFVVVPVTGALEKKVKEAAPAFIEAMEHSITQSSLSTEERLSATVSEMLDGNEGATHSAAIPTTASAPRDFSVTLQETMGSSSSAAGEKKETE